MRHHKKARKFGREKNQRRALMRSLLRALIRHDSIKTTEARAKELRPLIERLITAAKKGTPANRRLVSARLGGAAGETKKLFTEIAAKYDTRRGGYTRIVKMPPRSGSGRREAQISFV
jgi:large subunit ribosomal protein L17